MQLYTSEQLDPACNTCIHVWLSSRDEWRIDFVHYKGARFRTLILAGFTGNNASDRRGVALAAANYAAGRSVCVVANGLSIRDHLRKAASLIGETLEAA